MATVNLFVHAPSSHVSTERRFATTITIGALCAQLEHITGIPPSSQTVSLVTTRSDDPDARAAIVANLTPNNISRSGGNAGVTAALIPGIGDTDGRTLQSFGAVEGMGLHVVDLRPPDIAGQWTDDSKVEKFEMDDDTYAKRRDTVRAFKERNKIGRFDANAPVTPEVLTTPKVELPENLKPGARCLVDLTASDQEASSFSGRRGTVRYVGDIKVETGIWVGIEYDEPVGKNDGSIQGASYFKCRPKHGGFVRPDKVVIGDFPEEEINIDSEEDEEM